MKAIRGVQLPAGPGLTATSPSKPEALEPVSNLKNLKQWLNTNGVKCGGTINNT